MEMPAEHTRHDKEDESTKIERLRACLSTTKSQKKVSAETGSPLNSFAAYSIKSEREEAPPLAPFPKMQLAPVGSIPPHEIFSVKKPNPIQVGQLEQVKQAFANSRVPAGARKAYEEMKWQEEMERRRLMLEARASQDKTLLFGVGLVAVIALGYFGYLKVTEIAQMNAKAALMEQFYRQLPEAAKQAI